MKKWIWWEWKWTHTLISGSGGFAVNVNIPPYIEGYRVQVYKSTKKRLAKINKIFVLCSNSAYNRKRKYFLIFDFFENCDGCKIKFFNCSNFRPLSHNNIIVSPLYFTILNARTDNHIIIYVCFYIPAILSPLKNNFEFFQKNYWQTASSMLLYHQNIKHGQPLQSPGNVRKHYNIII